MALGGMVAGLVAARRRGLYNKMTAVLIGVGGKFAEIDVIHFAIYVLDNYLNYGRYWSVVLS